jgi:DNA-binding transcriptional ArsR family regulator
MSAATVAASKTAAPPVSVRRNSRSGVCRFRAQAVRPVNGDGLALGSALLLVALHDDHGRSLPFWASLPALAITHSPESLDIFLYGYMIPSMARAATTADAFNAVAEPRRRQILDVLAGGERPVNDVVRLLGLAQPQVSKHLRVLREVGVVDVRNEGRQRLYRLNGPALKPIHDWVKNYERSWSERFDELDVVLEELKQKEEGNGSE